MKTWTNKAIEVLREEGNFAESVERWIGQPHQREGRGLRPGFHKDLFGFADVIAIGPKIGTLLVQVTARSSMTTRLKEKILPSPEARLWLQLNNSIEVWGFKKVKGRWQVTKREVFLSDFEAQA